MERAVVVISWTPQFVQRLALDQSRFLLNSGSRVELMDLTPLITPIYAVLYKKYYLLFPRIWNVVRWFKESQQRDFLQKIRHRQRYSAPGYFTYTKHYKKRAPRWKREPEVLQHTYDVQHLYLDARGKSFSEASSLEKFLLKYFIQSLVLHCLHIYSRYSEIGTWYLYNGRFPADNVLSNVLRSSKKKVFYFEVGFRPASIAVYSKSPHSFQEHKERAMELWSSAPSDKRVEQCKAFMQRRTSRANLDPTFWGAFQKPGYLRKLPSQLRVVTFFLSTEGEISSLSSEEKVTLCPNQWESLNWLIQKLDFSENHLVMRAHPSYSESGEKDPFLRKSIHRNLSSNSFTYIASNDPDDSTELLYESDLVCVYDSTMAMDAIFIQKPVLIFGMPYFSVVLPKKFKNLDEVDLNNLDSLTYEEASTFPWVFYLLNNGRRLMDD